MSIWLPKPLYGSAVAIIFIGEVMTRPARDPYVGKDEELTPPLRNPLSSSRLQETELLALICPRLLRV